MKKKLLLAILTLALACATVLCISAETPKVIQPGDVNGDREINAVDLVLLSQYIAGWDVILGGDSHTVVIDPAVPATCTQTGLTEGKHCSDCGMILVKQQVVPTIPHDFVETLVQPTTATQGYTLCKCTVCGHEEKKDFIPPVNSNGLAVEVNTANKTCVITGIGTCTDTDINIPEKISGYTVVGIADKAFSEQTQITSITIPNTVKTLGYRAFYGCTSLTEFTVPASVTSIGHQVFYKCDNLATVYYNSSFWPDKNNVFLNIPSIKTVVFGGIKVPSYIAYNCSNIENITIKNSVTSIGYMTFYGCSSLTSVEIPNSVASIGEDAFTNCNSLKNLYISDLESWLNIDLASGSSPLRVNLYIDGVLATDIEIPDTVTSIGSYAFNSCDSLTSVVIPDSVTSIGKLAFYNCNSLKSIEIPDSVTSIGDSAFFGCSSLTSVDIPNSVTSIGGSAFSNCNRLTSVIIPDSVMSIGQFAFYGCSKLTSVVIPDSITSIGDWVFRDCSRLNSIVIPDSVIDIGDSAFNGCDGLARIYYGGDEEDWKAITIDYFNSPLTSATRYYYSETQPTESGNYWRYVDGKPTPW